MENVKMLEILKRVKICIDRDSPDIAKDLVKIEIENLQGITQQRCQNTKYYFYDWYCMYCENLNCSSNQSR